MSGIGHALVNLFTVLTVRCIGIKGKIQHMHLGKYSTVETNTAPASFEVCSQVYNMEIKVNFSL